MAQALGYVTKMDNGGFKGVINMISLRRRMEIVPNNTNRDRPVVDLEAGDERLMASYQPCSAAIVAPVADVASNLDPLTGDESRTDHPCTSSPQEGPKAQHIGAGPTHRRAAGVTRARTARTGERIIKKGVRGRGRGDTAPPPHMEMKP